MDAFLFLGGGTLLKVQGRKVMPHSEERIFRRSLGWSTILARAIFPETQWEPFRSFRVVQHVSVDTETYEMVREMFPGRQPIRLNYQELELLRGVLPVQHLPYRPTVQPEETSLFALHQDSL